MGNSTSTEKTVSHGDSATKSTSGVNVSTSTGYNFEKVPAPPVVTASTSTSSSSHKLASNHNRLPFRPSVTAPTEEPHDVPDTATSDTPPELHNDSVNPDDEAPRSAAAAAADRSGSSSSSEDANDSRMTTTTTATTPAAVPSSKAVPVSTKRTGWVSSTGNASPWYGSLSSSASSHHRSESVRGPYYRTRGMSIHRDHENEDDAALSQSYSQQTQAAQRLPRSKSTLREQKGVPTIITWSQGGQSVFVTGTFNGWKHKIKLVKSTHDFSVVLELPPGTHRLKFIVDDEWKCSNDMETATDPEGNLVNYLQVLDENEEPVDEFGDSSIEQDLATSRPATPTEEYTSEIPAELLALATAISSEEDSEQSRRIAAEWERGRPQPPSLPPHLEKVLLNSAAVSEEDNSVLPEPNHVMLNHLYASSIKDNVMALSTTTRYRKKYVTTIFYRPVFPKNQA